MAHLSAKPLLAQVVDEVGDAKYTSQTEITLKEFGKCAVALRKLLYQDGPLNEAEFLFMDSHFHTLQMAYFRWKRKQAWPVSVH